MIAENLEQNTSKSSVFYNTLLKLSIPIVIQNLITSSINAVDTLMIGKLGEVEIAAVGIANQYFFLFNLLIIGITSGAGIFISQYWGQKDEKNIHRTLGLSLISSTVFSILFTIVAMIIPEYIMLAFNKDPYVIQLGTDYLKIVSISYVFTAISLVYGVSSRCVEDTIGPMLVSIIALLTNASLNYIFIFGHLGFPAMGVKGAAIATLVARVVETIALIIYIFFKKGILAAKFKSIMDISKDFIERSLKTIIPVVINDMCWALAMIIYAIAYGYLGTQAMAAVQITTTIQNVFMVFTFGLANGASVMIGHQVGAGNIDISLEYTKRFIKLSTIVGIVIGILLAISSPLILSFFNISQEVYQSALRILYIIAITMVIKVIGIVNIVGILRGGGAVSYSLKVEALTMWLVGVPLVFFGSFILKLPVEWVVLLVSLEEVAKVIFTMKKLKGKEWIRQII